MNIVMIGGGGHGKVIIDILEQAGERVVGILDAHLPIGERILGYEVIGRDDDLPLLIDRMRIDGVVIGIGDNGLRGRIASKLKADFPSMLFPNAIHPAAQLAKGVRLGIGNVIMAGCVINSDTLAGDFCIFNTNCSVDHDGKIGNCASLAPNSCAGGYVEIGRHGMICLGANIIDRIKIGDHTVVGAGATVIRDLPPNVVAYGTPARIIRSVGDRYAAGQRTTDNVASWLPSLYPCRGD